MVPHSWVGSWPGVQQLTPLKKIKDKQSSLLCLEVSNEEKKV
jgi:hypothetical protein